MFQGCTIRNGELCADEIDYAETCWIRTFQAISFANENRLSAKCNPNEASKCGTIRPVSQAVKGPGQECKVEIWLDSYISCYICFTKLTFSLIIKLDVLPCLNILS